MCEVTRKEEWRGILGAAGKACQRLGMVTLNGHNLRFWAVEGEVRVEMALRGDSGRDLASGWPRERTGGKGGRALQKGWALADLCRVVRVVVEGSIFW